LQDSTKPAPPGFDEFTYALARVDVSTIRNDHLDRRFPFARSKEHRPHASLVCDAAVLTDQVETLRHRRVGRGHRIIHFVDDRGEFERHLQHAGLANFDALVEGLVLSNEHTFFDVLVDLPAVGRVYFLDVDREEIDPITIGTIDSVEGPSLGPEGRSGVAPKHQGDRAVHESLSESDRLALGLALAGQVGQLEIGSLLADPGLRIRAERLNLGNRFVRTWSTHRCAKPTEIEPGHFLGFTALHELIHHGIDHRGRIRGRVARFLRRIGLISQRPSPRSAPISRTGPGDRPGV